MEMLVYLSVLGGTSLLGTGTLALVCAFHLIPRRKAHSRSFRHEKKCENTLFQWCGVEQPRAGCIKAKLTGRYWCGIFLIPTNLLQHLHTFTFSIKQSSEYISSHQRPISCYFHRPRLLIFFILYLDFLRVFFFRIFRSLQHFCHHRR